MSHENTQPDPRKDPRDAALEARLTQILRDEVAVPADLTNRVYQASRGHLPAPQPVAQLASAADQQLQEHLTATLSQVSVPDGLTDRVYEASVASLPGHLRITTTPPAARWDRSIHVRGRLAGGRLAMAASLAVVACVGIWFARMPGMPGGGPNIARNSPDEVHSPTGPAAEIRLTSADSHPTDSDWRLLEAVDHGHNEVRYLVETDHLSLESLSDELTAMLNQPGS